MNHYKNLIKLVKPEYQPHYYLQKKVNGENKFGLFFKRPDYKKGNSNGVLILDVRNSQNLIEVHKKGENPYISDCSYIWNEELYKQLDIPDAVSDFIYYLVDSNNRKNYFYLFFYNIFNKATISVKKSNYLTKIKCLISKDLATIEYFLVTIISNIDFNTEMSLLIDDKSTQDMQHFERCVPYVKNDNLIINVKTGEVFCEDKNGLPINIMSIDTFKQQNILNTETIKQTAKDALMKKISHIDGFEWSN